MKHNIRINGKVQELDCELGSGILDKNGKEIFEGDKVRSYDDNGDCVDEGIVRFERGVLYMDSCGSIDFAVQDYDDGELEIVDD